MTSGVCTLLNIEGDYHLGLAALVNTLYHVGYRGNIWAGYTGRGPLPPWVKNPKKYQGFDSFQAAPECRICFVPLDSSEHITTHKTQSEVDLGFDPKIDIMFYKSPFMLGLFERNPKMEKLFYFDTDVVVMARWSFFEMWVECGLGLCEDINSPLHHTHPIRHYWRSMYEPYGFEFKNTTDVYVNSGFVGISREHRDFLATWQKILQIMQPRIPNLAAAHNAGRTYPFWRWEQDGLNIAMACMDTPVSLINREGMDFAGLGFGCYLAHWSGRPKPWSTQLTARALQGYPPKERDRMYLHHTRSPINVYTPWERWRKRLDLNCATAISRFYVRPFE